MDKFTDIKMWPEPDSNIQPKITEFFKPVSRKRTAEIVCEAASTEVSELEIASTSDLDEPPAKRPATEVTIETQPQLSIINDMPTEIFLEETTVITSQELDEERATVKKRRQTYTAQKKKEVVDYAKKHSLYKASLHYNLSSGTIWPWMRQDFSKLSPQQVRAAGSGRKLSYSPHFEPELAQYILEQQDLKPTITTQDIMEHACTMIKPSCPTFKGTRGWYQKFQARNNLISPENEPLSQKLPSPLETRINEFLESVNKVRMECDYPLELIGNMDEITIQIDMVSNRKADKNKADVVFPTYTIGGEKISYTVGAEKYNITVVLTALANGDLLPPMLIFKGVKPFKSINTPSGWLVCVQENGQLDQGLMDVWIKEIWFAHTQQREALLFIDACHGHLPPDYTVSLREGHTKLLQLPPGCSSKLQPVAFFLAKPLKDTVNRLCSEFYKSKLENITVKLRSATKEDICPWIVQGFNRLSKLKEQVKICFKATGLTLALDKSDAHLYRADLPLVEKEKTERNNNQVETESSVPEVVGGEEQAITEVPFDDLDSSLNSIKTLYSYMLQIHNKSIIDTDMQLLEEQLQTHQ